MEFDNSFEVPLPPEQAWPVLMDVRGIAPCMPGAELTDVVDDKTYKGKIGVRLGPVALTFAGLVTFEEIDNDNYSARVKAQGTDAKGRGSANAVSTFRLELAGTGSKVLVHTDLTLSGSVAQYGRGVGMIQATASALMNQFANNLKKQIGQSGQPAAPPPASQPASAEPVPLEAAAAAIPSSEPAESAPAVAPQQRIPIPSEPPRPMHGDRISHAPAKPISGFSLMLTVLWTSIRNLFGGSRNG